MSKKTINKSIEFSKKLLQEVYNIRDGYRTYHFAFIWKRSNLISIGINNPLDESIKALKLANIFNIKYRKDYYYLCAEMSAISKIWGKVWFNNQYKMVILRLNKHEKLQNSYPCDSCLKVMKRINLNRIYFSNEKGKIFYKKIT